jgi:hypothetical protein
MRADSSSKNAAPEEVCWNSGARCAAAGAKSKPAHRNEIEKGSGDRNQERERERSGGLGGRALGLQHRSQPDNEVGYLPPSELGFLRVFGERSKEKRRRRVGGGAKVEAIGERILYNV